MFNMRGISPYLSWPKFYAHQIWKNGGEIQILREGRFLLLLGSKGVKAHLGMNVGTRRFGRRGRHAHVDFLGRWCGQFYFGKSSKAFQTVRKGLGFCVAMILISEMATWINGFMEKHRRLSSMTSEMWMPLWPDFGRDFLVFSMSSSLISNSWTLVSFQT